MNWINIIGISSVLLIALDVCLFVNTPYESRIPHWVSLLPLGGIIVYVLYKFRGANHGG